MQRKVELTQFLNLFDHVQYMIDDRCSLPHSSIENGATSLVLLNIVKSTKGLSQYLEHFL